MKFTNISLTALSIALAAKTAVGEGYGYEDGYVQYKNKDYGYGDEYYKEDYGYDDGYSKKSGKGKKNGGGKKNGKGKNDKAKYYDSTYDYDTDYYGPYKPSDYDTDYYNPYKPDGPYHKDDATLTNEDVTIVVKPPGTCPCWDQADVDLLSTFYAYPYCDVGYYDIDAYVYLKNYERYLKAGYYLARNKYYYYYPYKSQFKCGFNKYDSQYKPLKFYSEDYDYGYITEEQFIACWDLLYEACKDIKTDVSGFDADGQQFINDFNARTDGEPGGDNQDGDGGEE